MSATFRLALLKVQELNLMTLAHIISLCLLDQDKGMKKNYGCFIFIQLLELTDNLNKSY
jgi:hypothetical protein